MSSSGLSESSIRGLLNINMPSYQYRNLLYRDKTISRPSTDVLIQEDGIFQVVVCTITTILCLNSGETLFKPTEAQGSVWRWRHNGRDSVSNHQPHHCLLNRLFRRRSKKTSKLRVTGLCVGNSPRIGEFPAQMASNAEMFSFDDVIMTIGSSNGLSYVRYQGISWTNDDWLTYH